MRVEPRRHLAAVAAVVAVGGAVGAAARFGVAHLVKVHGFPWTTLVINVTGSLLLGVTLTVVSGRDERSARRKALIATGFLGAFTTYSTFAVETVLLARAGHSALAGLSVVASVAGGIAAAAAGMIIGFAFRNRRRDATEPSL